MPCVLPETPTKVLSNQQTNAGAHKRIGKELTMINPTPEDFALAEQAITDTQATCRKQEKLLMRARIALTFYNNWMQSHDGTQYPSGREVENEIREELSGN
jgi:hypothetical protein